MLSCNRGIPYLLAQVGHKLFRIADHTGDRSCGSILRRSEYANDTNVFASCEDRHHISAVSRFVYPLVILLSKHICIHKKLEGDVQDLLIAVAPKLGVDGRFLSSGGLGKIFLQNSGVNETERVEAKIRDLVILTDQQHNLVIAFRHTSGNYIILC